MDFEKLLAKYMAHVLDCEGVTFVGHIPDHSDGEKFNADEVEVLERMAHKLGDVG